MTPETEAERRLLEGAATGETVVLGEDLPEANDRAREVRASFLRHLLTEAADHVDPRGLWLRGAWVSGAVDFCGLTLRHRLRFEACRFDGRIGLLDTRLRTLECEHCTCDGIDGRRMVVEGSLLLANGFESAGRLDFEAAHIKGKLTLEDLHCAHKPQGTAGDGNPIALMLESARIDGALLLRRGFHARGAVRAYGARIGMNVELYEARLGFASAEMPAAPDALGPRHGGIPDIPPWGLDLEKATIGGALYLSGDTVVMGGMRLYEAKVGSLETRATAFLATRDAPAVDAQFCRISGALLICEDTVIRGFANFGHAHAEVLLADAETWPDAMTVIDGMTYGRIGATSIEGIPDAALWLSRQIPAHLSAFRPQPWEQCARVLHNMGREEDARRLRILKERHWLRSERAEMGEVRRAAAWLLHQVLDVTIRFGYRPALAGIWLLALIGLGWVIVSWFGRDAFDAIATKPPTFRSLAYSADVFIPVVKLGMADAFRPKDTWLQAAVWIYQILGWALAGFWVAGLTGITKR